MPNVAHGLIDVGVLTPEEQAFLREHGFLGQEPGEDAVAILAQLSDGKFMFIRGAACPNNLRRAFPKLLAGAGKDLSLRMAGATVFLVSPNPLQAEGGINEGSVALLGWDRRELPLGHFCATAQGGVGGEHSFFEGACAEIGDELYLTGVLEGRVVRIVPEGFPMELLPALSAPNPFGVPFDKVIQCGPLKLVGYHDYTGGGFISAMYTWDFPGLRGMTPLFAFSPGTYNAAWQDAFIPIQGSEAKARVQGTFFAFQFTSLRQGIPLAEVPSLGSFQGTQGYMMNESQVGFSHRPTFHPTAVAWAASISS